jgi:hypothetical protein
MKAAGHADQRLPFYDKYRIRKFKMMMDLAWAILAVAVLGGKTDPLLGRNAKHKGVTSNVISSIASCKRKGNRMEGPWLTLKHLKEFFGFYDPVEETA